MKRIKVDYSLPAFLSNFSQDEVNEKFTRAQLKIMYIGETKDKRVFTEDFAKELIKTLPYTPVVSYYDTKNDDFIGHHSEQAIYGIVDPLIPAAFEEDASGKTWAIASVILYTERPDMTGEIAKKIVGKSQSLEMDPNTVEYKLNYEGKVFKNIEFTKGSFIGLSVLGDNQQPAFTGSAFFTEQSASAFAQLKEYCSNRGKNKMNVEQIYSFVELSWGEKYQAINKALNERYGEYAAYVVDFYDDHVVAWIYSEDKETQLMKIMYSLDETGVATLGEEIPVRVVYEPIQPASSTVAEQIEPAVEEIPVAEVVDSLAVEEKEEEEEEEDKENAAIIEATVSTEPVSKTTIQETSEIVTAQVEKENQPVEENKEIEKDDENEEAATHASTLTSREQEELAAYRLQEKLALVESYAVTVPQTVLASYASRVDEFTLAELKNQLNEQFVKYSTKKASKKSKTTFLSFSRENDANKPRSIEELVAKYK